MPVTLFDVNSSPIHSKIEEHPCHIVAMDFEWDEAKARKNEWKHHVTFQEAAEVFGDDFSSCVPDPDHSKDEERYLLFGISAKGNHLVVSFTERPNAIRIISARRMIPLERKAYEQ